MSKLEDDFWSADRLSATEMEATLKIKQSDLTELIENDQTLSKKHVDMAKTLVAKMHP